MNMHTSIDRQLSPSESVTCVRDLLETTLAIIDELGLPAQIGAHLDLALNRVDELIAANAAR